MYTPFPHSLYVLSLQFIVFFGTFVWILNVRSTTLPPVTPFARLFSTITNLAPPTAVPHSSACIPRAAVTCMCCTHRPPSWSRAADLRLLYPSSCSSLHVEALLEH
ncbi:hypothetical protein SLA2020_288750 [Shorea laevis]